MDTDLIKQAGPVASWVLRAIGLDGIAMPWGLAYIVPESFDDEQVHVHERHHLFQMQRDGVLVFVIRYVWWGVRYGYTNNPYEIEARQRAEWGVTSADVIAKGLKRPLWWPD